MCDSHVTGASTHLQSEFKLSSTQSHLEVKGHTTTITVQILKYILLEATTVLRALRCPAQT